MSYLFHSHLSHIPWHLGILAFRPQLPVRSPKPFPFSSLPSSSPTRGHPSPPAEDQGQTPLSPLRCCSGAGGPRSGWSEALGLRRAGSLWPPPIAPCPFPPLHSPLVHPPSCHSFIQHIGQSASFLPSPIYPEPAQVPATQRTSRAHRTAGTTVAPADKRQGLFCLPARTTAKRRVKAQATPHPTLSESLQRIPEVLRGGRR